MSRNTWLIVALAYLFVAAFLSLGFACGFRFDRIRQLSQIPSFDYGYGYVGEHDNAGGMMSFGSEGYSYSNFPLMLNCVAFTIGFIPFILIFPEEGEFA